MAVVSSGVTEPERAPPVREPAQGLRLPDHQTVFRNRALRFRSIAREGGSLATYLSLLAVLADTQHLACAATLSGLTSRRLEPGWASRPASAPDHSWLKTLEHLLPLLAGQAPQWQRVASALMTMHDAELDSIARQLIGEERVTVDKAQATVIGAALQAHWTAYASLVDITAPSVESGSSCPVCGSGPVASVILTGSEVQGLRYLSCSLCSSEWRFPRIHCVNCGRNGKISYCGIQGSNGTVRAETCDDCLTYTKILDREKRTDLDPCADDVASLSLDLLMSETGYQRLGVNPFMLPGA